MKGGEGLSMEAIVGKETLIQLVYSRVIGTFDDLKLDMGYLCEVIDK